MFGSRGTSKVLVLDGPFESRASPQAAAGNDSYNLKIGAAARFRRSGSKVLSKLGFRSTRGIFIQGCLGLHIIDS